MYHNSYSGAQNSGSRYFNAIDNVVKGYERKFNTFYNTIGAGIHSTRNMSNSIERIYFDSGIEKAIYAKSIPVISDGSLYREASRYQKNSYAKIDFDRYQKFDSIVGVSTNQENGYDQVHNMFLLPNRPIQRFIGVIEEVAEYIEKTYRLIFDSILPKDIIIKILNKLDFKKIYMDSDMIWQDGILGFARNIPFREIVIKENELDILMLTIGHELGHVLAKQLNDEINEEAKAFAFEYLWAKTIEDHNIANLKSAIKVENINPAQNGIHNVAFEFVLGKIRDNEFTPKQLFDEICHGRIKVAVD